MDPTNSTIPPVAAPIGPSPIPVEMNPPANPPKNKKLLFLLLSLVGALFVLLSSCTVMYAYGIIPAGNKAFQESVSSFVQGLPFMPKTLPYVLNTSIKAHEKVTKFTIDASVAGTSTGSISLLGGNNFDMQIKGPLDYTNPQNPMLFVNLKINKDLDLDYLRKAYVTYFRITKIPATISLLITGFLGVNETEFLNKWLYYDETLPVTLAREVLDAKEIDNKKEIQKAVTAFFETLEDPEVLKSLTMKNESMGSLPMYHIHFAPSDQVLDTFSKKYEKSSSPNPEAITSDKNTSETTTNFVMDLWIDRNTYLVRKSIVTFTLKGTSASTGYDTTSPSLSLLPTQTADIDISTVVILSDYGKQMEFVTPPDAVEFSDYLQSLSSKVASNSADLSR